MSDEPRRSSLPWSGFKSDRRDQHEAIVRELASTSPSVDSDLGDYCWSCGKVGDPSAPLSSPESHEPSCLWRRSREIHPGEPAAQL